MCAGDRRSCSVTKTRGHQKESQVYLEALGELGCKRGSPETLANWRGRPGAAKRRCGVSVGVMLAFHGVFGFQGEVTLKT